MSPTCGVVCKGQEELLRPKSYLERRFTARSSSSLSVFQTVLKYISTCVCVCMISASPTCRDEICNPSATFSIVFAHVGVQGT